MSCYRPLIYRWRRNEHVPADTRHHHKRVQSSEDTRHHHKHVQSSENHVETITNRKGVTLTPDIGPQQLNIKIGHDHSSTPQYIYDQEPGHQHQPRGVLSLGLPLGISSLKLGSRRRRKQKKRNQVTSNSCGHQSDGEAVRHRTLGLENDWYQTLTKSSHTINDQDDLIDSPISTSFQNANIPIAKSHYHAERKSSLPRKAKIVSGYDDLQQRQPRSLSVDADQMIQSVTRDTCVSPRVPACTDSDDILKFAGLTSPSQFMMSRDKSSSGNSSGCGSDVTADTDSDWRHHAPPRSQSRSRAPVNVITTQGPPPRHLLPAKLRPAPGVKCHPYVLLPHQIHRGIFIKLS